MLATAIKTDKTIHHSLNEYGHRVAKTDNGSIFVREIPPGRRYLYWTLEACIDGEWFYETGNASKINALFNSLTF